MRCADDLGNKNSPLDKEVIAERCSLLCRVAEDTHADMYRRKRGTPELLYVIGTEVPAPGGSDEVEEGLKITKVEDFEETIALTKEHFYRNNLQRAWERVIAVVVQPGVEHGDHTIIEYDRQKAEELTDALKKHPGIVFEGHATDYQTGEGLKAMVEDGIAFLKVGPSLTFSAREALFLLNYIEDELFSRNDGKKHSHFIRTLEQAMLKNPVHWKKHYTGSEWELSFARKYSLFDRSRYYWGDEDVVESLRALIENLRSVDLPPSLISQFFPAQYAKIRRKKLDKDPESLIRDRIRGVLADYSFAVG
jgi:D-tagatose-1,6-bisphosphate aldolase subunit GatZ/KbaZ